MRRPKHDCRRAGERGGIGGAHLVEQRLQQPAARECARETGRDPEHGDEQCLPHWGAAWSHFALIKPGCPCGAADEDRVKKMKAHYDQMTSLEGKDDALQTRLQALVDGQKIR